MDRAEFASKIDHTLLKPAAAAAEISQLCAEARTHGFYSVCVNPGRVGQAVAELRGSPVETCAVVGFPLGANTARLKLLETEQALRDGARSIDIVMNVGLLQDGARQAVLSELRQAQGLVAKAGTLKVIIETALLSEAQKRVATELVMASGAAFIKTSTGTIPHGGATVADVQLMRAVAGDALRIKASGGIGDLPMALALLDAGADRLGTSRSVALTLALPAAPRPGLTETAARPAASI